MSNATGTSGSDRPPSGRPYEVLAYGSLVMVFMIQLFEGSPLGVLVFACGLVVMIGKLQLGPIYYLVVLAGIQVAKYNQGVRPNNLFRPIFFGFNDVILCLCVVAFVASHYRLQGIWLHHLARDSRWLPAVKTRMQSFRLLRGQRLTPSDEGRRAPEQITQAEVSWLILSLPIWALLAIHDPGDCPGTGSRNPALARSAFGRGMGVGSGDLCRSAFAGTVEAPCYESSRCLAVPAGCPLAGNTRRAT